MYRKSNAFIPFIVHDISKSAQAPICVNVTKLTNEDVHTVTFTRSQARSKDHRGGRWSWTFKLAQKRS